MDKLRDFLQSWPGRIFMLLCLSPMVLLGLEGYFGGGALTPDQVAKVGDTPITMNQLQSEMTASRTQLLENYDAAMINEQALQSQTLENLINRTLLETQASLLGMHLSDETITRLLQADSTFADANGQFSNDLFAQYLQQNGLTKDRLFDNYRNQINIRNLMNGILTTAIYPQSQISRLIELQTESRPLWVKRLAWQDYADKVTVTDSEINQYYNTHKDTLISPEMVDLQVLAIDPSQVTINEPTENELKALYNSSLVNTKQLAHIVIADSNAAKIVEVQAQIAANKDFASLAKTYSDDPTGEMGGEIGLFNATVFGTDAKAVQAAIANLGKGEVSAPVKTRFGTHFFKVIDVGQAQSFEEQKAALKAQAVADRQKQAYDSLIVDINNKVADEFSLKDIASEYKLPIISLNNYTKTNNTTAYNQPSVIAAAFDDLTVAEQGVSPNLQINDKTVWVQPTNHRQSTAMDLTAATPVIKQRLLEEKSIALALQDATAQAAKINESNLSSLQSLGDISRRNPAINDEERGQLFVHRADNGVAVWTVPTKAGVSIFAGGKITQTSQSVMSPTEQAMASAIIKDNAGQDYLEDYLHYLRSTHEVQVNEDVLKGL